MLKKRVLVTGGSGIIGGAICIKLSEEYDVTIGFYNSDKSALEILARCNKVRRSNHKIICLKNIKSLIKSNEIDDSSILVHCAGFSDETQILNISNKQFQKQINLSLFSFHELTKLFIPFMKKNKFGRFIFISSVGSIEGGTRQAHYAAAKAATNSYVRSLGKEYGRFGITANSLLVGLVKTPMIINEIKDGTLKDKIDKIPLKRIGKPEEIAFICSMLCHPLGGFVNSQSINVDGGYIPT